MNTCCDGNLSATRDWLARIRHRFVGKIGQTIVRTAYFRRVRNTGVYFQAAKIRCADNGLARAREIGGGSGPAAFNRISWREALSGLGRHASGLHRYRELRARALEDALAGEDCTVRRRGD